MNKARKGRSNDRRTAKFLAGYGFYNSMQSAASAGVFDTICWNKNAVIFIQNKTNRLPGKDEILQLIRTETPDCSLRFMFVWLDYKRKPQAWLLDYKTDQANLLEDQELEQLLFQYNRNYSDPEDDL